MKNSIVILAIIASAICVGCSSSVTATTEAVPRIDSLEGLPLNDTLLIGNSVRVETSIFNLYGDAEAQLEYQVGVDAQSAAQGDVFAFEPIFIGEGVATPLSEVIPKQDTAAYIVGRVVCTNDYAITGEMEFEYRVITGEEETPAP